MKKKVQKNAGVAFVFALLCATAGLPVHAKTVALWKLDYSPYTGLNARCLVDPANDFDVVIQGQQKEPPSTRPPLPSGMSGPWSPQPPNPDTTEGLLDTTDSTNAILYTHGILFSTPGVAPAVNSLTNSFTVEGWHYNDGYFAPALGTFNAFFSLGRPYAVGGWSFGFFNYDDTNNLHCAIFDYHYGNGSTARLFPTPVAKNTRYLNWCHYALVYDSAGGGGLGTWEIFLNATSHGVITNQTAPTTVGTQTTFCLGGDIINSQYGNRGGYDTWRISDQALEPNQFLNAGVATTATQKTLAFYRLDVNGDGSFDLSNRVANAHHLQASVGNVRTQVTANAAQAVVTVPNPDASAQFRGNRAFNSGSIAFRTGATAGADSYLISADGLGTRLGTNSAWTIEAWINFTSLTTRQVIFDVKASVGAGAGWMFMNYNVLSSRYCLFIGAPPGVYLGFPGSTGGSTETPLNAWHHLALTFDPAAGPGYQGAWECFLDSASLGVIPYSNSYQRVDSSVNFLVGGRGTALGDSVYGSMDLVRVSQGILATNQFLNAGGYAATTNAVATLAYWKLESDGTSADASSQVEPRYGLGVATNTAPPAGSVQRVAGTLLKVDTTPGFIGDPAANAGSLLFTNGTGLTAGNLGVRLELDTPFTVEGWMKWDGSAARDIQALAGTRFDTESGWLLPPIGTANRVLFGVPSGWLLTLEKRGTDVAFHIACDTAATNVFTGSDAVIDADLAVLPAAHLANRWRHVALAYEPDVDDRGQWTFYLDGVETGSATHAEAPFFNHDSHRFLLGGRAAGEASFDGWLDCWRVSNGALDSEDLLYVNMLRGTLLRVY